MERLTSVKNWKYWGLDLQTGEIDVRTVRVSRVEFLEYLSLWNGTNPLQYKFWEVEK